MIRNKIMIGMALVLLTGSAITAAQAEVEVSLDATYADSYNWRGIPLNEEPVLQPSIDLAGGAFFMNVWGNMDLTDYGDSSKPLRGYGDETGDFTEVDYTAGYETQIGPVSLGFGYITYTFPNHVEWGAGLSTTEVYLGLGFDLPLSPSITTYVDVDNQGKTGSEGANYTSLDLGHSFEIADNIGLDIGGHIGYANHKFLKFYYGINEESDFHDYSLSLGLPITLPAGFTLTPAYAYAALMEDESREEVDDVWKRQTETGIFMVSLGRSFSVENE